MKTKITISDSLLGAVFGCECRFFLLVDNELKVSMSYEQNEKYKEQLENEETNELLEPNDYNGYEGIEVYKINLDTFIRIAKIKAFEAGHKIVEQPFYIDAINIDNTIHRTFKSVELYGLTEMIKALEYVNNRIQEG